MSERKRKKAKQRASKKKNAPPTGDKRKFDQLLDDAIFGVTKKR